MRTRFITSCARAAQFPDLAWPEIAVIGRSNVGKSSLINALIGARRARISRTPGRTQLINYFECIRGDEGFTMADLPGYGFAKVPRRVKADWGTLLESYFDAPRRWAAFLVLMDIRRAPQADELSLAELIRDRGAEPLWVATKADKLPKAKRKPALQRWAQALGARSAEDIRATSILGGAGIEDLRDELFRRAERGGAASSDS